MIHEQLKASTPHNTIKQGTATKNEKQLWGVTSIEWWCGILVGQEVQNFTLPLTLPLNKYS